MGSLHIFANLFWLSGASRRPLKRLTVVLKKSTTRPSSTSKIVEHKWKDHNHTHKHQPPQNWKKLKTEIPPKFHETVDIRKSEIKKNGRQK